jgi:hypothetical protein
MGKLQKVFVRVDGYSTRNTRYRYVRVCPDPSALGASIFVLGPIESATDFQKVENVKNLKARLVATFHPDEIIVEVEDEEVPSPDPFRTFGASKPPDKRSRRHEVLMRYS